MILRPSASYIWSNCAMYPKARETVNYEPENDDAAREGTCAAWVAEQVFKGIAKSCRDLIGQTHANGWLVTSEMAYHIQGYVEAIRAMGGTVMVEQHVVISPRIQGSLDSSVIAAAMDRIRVVDLKYGYKPHNPFEHTQLLLYGIGEFRRLGSPATVTHVDLSIYQPRSWVKDGPLRTWTLTIEQLLEWERILIARGDLCYEPNPIATPGTWCENCPVLGCESRLNKLYANHEYLKSFEYGPMTTDDMANLRDFLTEHEAILKGVKTALDTEQDQRMNNGENVRGYKLEDRLGNRKFTVDAAAVAIKTGLNPFKQVLKSPAELESDGASKLTVKTISTRPNIGRKISKVSGDFFAKAFEE